MVFKIPPHADGIENPLFEGIHSHIQILIPNLKPNQTHESLGIGLQFHRIPNESNEPNAPLDFEKWGLDHKVSALRKSLW